jgi:PAS domain S-box-containing protein
LDAFRNVKPFVYDHRIVRADGQVRMLHTRGDVRTDGHGKLVCMVGSCWDTTELWQATCERDRSISLLRATLESTADGLLVIDSAGNVAAYNQQLLALWGLEREAMEKNNFETLLAMVHDQLENGEACLRRVRQLDAQPDAESFDSLRFRDGRFYERYSRPQRVGDQIVGRVWSYRDVTERERLLRSALFLADASRLLASLDEEQALEAMARMALSYMGEVCAIDLFTGSEPRRLLVLSRDGQHAFSPEPPAATTMTGASIYTVGTTSYMSVPLLAHGEALGALTFAADGERRYTDADLTLAIDLARRVELALENARLYRKARDALAARDEFLSVAAHELRGPLTSLHLAVQGLQQSPPAPAAARMLAIIEREDRRIGRFVDELLDVTRIRAGHLRFVFAPVDLVEVAREVASRSKKELTRSGSPLSITAPGAVVGQWDRARLIQVLTNLLSNAIKCGLGRPIELSIDSDGKAARLCVCDHGIGIAAEAQRRIFAPFERAVSDRHYGGLGLGLYIVRTVLEGLGGSVKVESQPGGPTTFSVELPIGKPA